MLLNKKKPVFTLRAKYLLIIFMSFGMLCISANTFAQTDAKTVAAEKRAEKRKDIKKFFKKLNPFKKHDDDADDNTTARAGNSDLKPVTPAPAPVPAPPAPSPSNTKQTNAATKKKVKKTTVKKTTTAQPFM